MSKTVQYCKGDILKTEATAIVNPVNCKGVMGAGLAAAVRKKYPKSYNDYRRACRQGAIKVGAVFVTSEPDMLLFHLPTKDHWKNQSKMEYVLSGLADLRRKLEALLVSSVAVPALGCGCGGLSWSAVQPVLEDALKDINTDVYIYPPLWYLNDEN